MDSEPKLISLISQLSILKHTTNKSFSSKFRSVITQIISLFKSMDSDFDSEQETETELMSLASQAIAYFKSMDSDSQPDPLKKLISSLTLKPERPDSKLRSLVDETISLEPLPELISLIQKMMSLVASIFSKPELKLKSLITQLIFLDHEPWVWDCDSTPDYFRKFILMSVHIISMVSSVDWDSQPKPESKLVSLVTQAISVFNSMDLDSQPEPLKNLIPLASPRSFRANFRDSDRSKFMDLYFLVLETLTLEPEPKLISLIHQIFSLVLSMNSKWKKLISLCPEVQVISKEGTFHVVEQQQQQGSSNHKWYCLPLNWGIARFPGEEEEDTHFLCRGCYGENHTENNKAPVEIKHTLHPKHSLQLAVLNDGKYRQCYCCDEHLICYSEDLANMFYYCLACDVGIKFTCVKKPLVLSIDHPKWHDHTLALFPSQAPLTCSLCALTHSNCLFYICPPCDFVVHQWCINNLPRVIKISRHPHRISFTPSFHQGDWFCGVCRKKINSDYGGYHCIKNGCFYVAHSECATQSNVWDGIELEGVPEEEVIEELESFLTISDGRIQHFSHKHHHLKLDEDTCRDYDDNRLCQACIKPI